MSSKPRGVLFRLFCTPALWASLSPGLVVVLLDSYCKSGPVDDALCHLDFFQHISTTGGHLILLFDGLLYAVLRFLDAKNWYQLNSRVSWTAEVVLFAIGQYLVLVVVMMLALVTMTGI
jgi:hypothetical protein